MTVDIDAIAPYLDDRRDRVVFAQRPLVMVPRHGALAALDVGASRYLAAADGIYLEARSAHLYCCQRIGEAQLPFGAVTPALTLAGGALPAAMLTAVVERFRELAPQEAAAEVLMGADGRYELREPETVSASPGHITLSDDADTDARVFDLHSHHDMAAYFSATDDASDRNRMGLYIALVIGRLQSRPVPEIAARVVCPPHLMEIAPGDVIEGVRHVA